MIKSQLGIGVSVMALIMAASLMSASSADAQAPDPNKIYEYDMSKSLANYAGEPIIAIDPQNPNVMAATANAIGQDQFPIYQVGSTLSEWYRAMASPFGYRNGDIYITTDGGYNWTMLPRPNPADKPPVSNTPFPRRGGSDPMIAFGPHGELYAAEEVMSLWRERPGYSSDLPDVEPAMAVSTDLGKTWSKPIEFGTPADRPWLVVDQSTGVVYTVSSGWLDLKNHTHNIDGQGIMDRWLVAYQPMLTSQTTPHRLGGPDFAATAGNTLAAANGIIAATFVIAPSGPSPEAESQIAGGRSGAAPSGGGAPPLVGADSNIYLSDTQHVELNGRYIPPPTRALPPEGERSDSTIPASLKQLLPSGVTECSRRQPCLFMETSKDSGVHWTRHYVPMPGGFSFQNRAAVNLAVDASHPGRYAIGVVGADGKSNRAVVSDNYGANWSSPLTIDQAGQPGIESKNWMDYGPTGVLSFMWKQQRDDMMPPTKDVIRAQPFYTRIPQYGFDVYNAVSCDGGFHWEKPVKVNSVTNPGTNNSEWDDLSYVAVGKDASFVVWGDTRVFPKVQPMMVLGAIGGIHAYFARVPFSVVTGGAQCGGK